MGAMQVIEAEIELRVKVSMIHTVINLCRENPVLWDVVKKEVEGGYP